MGGEPQPTNSTLPSGTLRVEPQTAERLEETKAVALLVGSYDGSGNFGDLAQLDAALGMLDRLGSDLLVLPVVEQQFAATHETMATEFRNRPDRVVYFDGGGDPGGEDMVPVELSAGLDLAISYLYGGGFLNPSWGERKLAMLRAVEDFFAGAGRAVRIASGQQVDAGWIAGLDAADAQMLRRFEFWGGRDDASAATLAGLESAGPALNTGDDAVGVLARVGAPPKTPASEAGTLDINVHFAEHEWVTDRPDSVREFDVAFLAALSRRADRKVRVQPLLAYLDPRIDERPGLERLTAACAEHDIEVAEPRILRPADADGFAAELGGAVLTISSSYHVALTSLLLAIPATILRDNDYYAQKAQGLLADFGLPQAFSPRSDENPEQVAGALAPHLLDPEARKRTRTGLEEAAARVRRRRVETEKCLLSLIGQIDGRSIRKNGAPRATMPSAPRHEIADIRSKPGELSFEARIAGREPQRVWIRSSTAVDPGPEAALAACLMPAMRDGGTLSMEEPVSPRLLRNQREYQAIQQSWSHGWHWGDPPLREVGVVAPTTAPEPRPPTGRVAAFFSGGVDSFATILANPDVTDLIFVRGVDILTRLEHQEGLADEVEAKLGEAAAELGMPLHVVEINLRDLSEPLVRWEYYSGCPLVAIALFFEPLFDRVLIATDTDHEAQPPMGTARLVDQLWSTERLEIVDDGGRFSREQRLRQIADHPVVRRTLRVCWENPEAAYNCGRCRKCMLTKIPLEAIGALDAIETFPPGLDLGLIENFEITAPIALTLWEDVLATAEEEGREDLAAPVRPMVARGRRTLGLPTWHRNRVERVPSSPPSVAELEEASGELEALLASRSWKLTAPLRRLGARARSLLRR